MQGRMLRRSMRQTLRLALLLGKASGEHLHFAHGLLVAFALGRRHAVAPRGERVTVTSPLPEDFRQALRRLGLGDDRLD